MKHRLSVAPSQRICTTKSRPGSGSDQIEARPPYTRWLALLLATALDALLAGCAVPVPGTGAQRSLQLPLLQGWYEGEEVFYVTTDVSNAQVAQEKGANFAPRLAEALPPLPRSPGQRSAVDKVYAFTNFPQASVFASAPDPMGYKSRSDAYSPLWLMMKVHWNSGQSAQTLRSEEEVLDAVEKGRVVLEETQVVLNCPIVHRGKEGGLPGVVLDAPAF